MGGWPKRAGAQRARRQARPRPTWMRRRRPPAVTQDNQGSLDVVVLLVIGDSGITTASSTFRGTRTPV